MKIVALVFCFIVTVVLGGCIEASVTTTTGSGGKSKSNVAPAPEPAPEPSPEPAPEPAPDAPAPDEQKEAPAPGGGGEEAVKKVCGQCHGLKHGDGTEIVKGTGSANPALKDIMQVAAKRPDWEAVVTRMKDGNGCKMTDDEKTEIVKWLDENTK